MQGVLFSRDGQTLYQGEVLDWQRLASEEVVKIVVGTLKTKSRLAQPLPEDLATLFPKLTHLHCWGWQEVTALPTLPQGLRCLDVRNCPDLRQIAALPETLDTLILDDCPSLALSPETQRISFPNLEDLSVREAKGMAESWLDAVLKAAPKLRQVNASGCPQLTRIHDWAPALEEIQLDRCTGLEALPARWPSGLIKIGLRGASALTHVADFHDSLDYIDLAEAESLQALPDSRGKPRTLFLQGSGIRVPPASEHGETANVNVAVRTAAYFEDVRLTGVGEVKRCKVLVLGNGGAGKTCLSLALAPGGDPSKAAELGSTHGVQFWDWKFKAKVDGRMEPIHLHLWDFGGQEIYHNTHRLFMSKGAVFIVVWHPHQDGRQAERAECGYQDEWRPLSYWLDLIHLACPHKPRIAIVCSHHGERTAALEQQWREQVSPEVQAQCRCFYLDSLAGVGECEALNRWLEDEVGGEITTQGTDVPSYWAIAQDLVENWVSRLNKDADFAVSHQQLSQDDFQQALESVINEAIANDDTGQLSKLKEAKEKGAFVLNEDRLRRTLAFLTNSGWVYWDPSLFESRVIVGQKWALDGLYAVLDRRENSFIYRKLNASDGRFTLPELDAWVWREAGYKETEQALLLSFMARCGLCFQLRRAEDAWRAEDVYVSFEHLPTAKELRLERLLDNRLGDFEEAHDSLTLPRMHRQHWQAFLLNAGQHYGKDARYALDGFFLENEEGERVLILAEFDAREIHMRVHGKNAGERLATVREHLLQFFPAPGKKVPAALADKPDPEQALGQAQEKLEVFISYAHDPDDGIPIGYEEPVNAIEAYLIGKNVTVVRDNGRVKFGDDLPEFMVHGAKRPHVIVVHSDKYWMSPYCMFELWNVLEEMRYHTNRKLLDVVIPIEHLDSGITKVETVEKYVAFWKAFEGTPRQLGWRPDELKAHVQSLLWRISQDLDARLDLNLHWKDGQDKVLEAIAERLQWRAQ